MKRLVIHSPSLGVYLESLGEHTVWMKPQDDSDFDLSFPMTFGSPEQAHDHLATWQGPPPADWRLVEVDADAAGFCTLAGCAVWGIPAAPEDERTGGWDERASVYDPAAARVPRADWAQNAAIVPGGKR